MSLSRLIPALVLLLLAAPSPAPAQETLTAGAVEQAVEALELSNVYVHPDAEPGLGEDEVAEVKEAIAGSDAGPVYVAILPADARDQTGGDTGELLRQVAVGVRRPGTYVVAAGRQLRAGSTVLPEGRAGALASEAVEAERAGGLAAIIVDLVRRVGDERAGRGGSGGGGGEGSSAAPLLVLLALGGGLFGISRLRRRRREREEMAEVVAAARDDLVALGDDIRSLDLDIEMPGADAAAREDYSVALAAYERGNEALRRARRPEELEAVGAAAEEGRFAIAAARARLAGRPVPERRPPCFFDPRHGPSTHDVEWAPPGGIPRPVPACTADAIAVQEGLEPASREVLVGGRSTPYWNAPPAFGPWAGGFYGGFGGFFPGLMFGTMLGGGFGLGGSAFGAESGGGGEGSFGDFGGDFGGGDFGGGGFGGGDF